MKKLIGIATIAIGLAPFVALADSLSGGKGGQVGGGADLFSVLGNISDLIRFATPIVVGLALLGFFWGLAVFIFSAGNAKKQAQGRSIMIWGILALFIMLSVFGIIGTLQSTFDVGNPTLNTNNIPSVPGPNGN